MVSVGEAVYRLRRVPPRRLPVLVGRYALRAARARARRWHIQRHRGELTDAELMRSLRGTTPEEVFDRFLSRFFVTPESARQVAAAIANSHPDSATRTKNKAQEALDHVFDLLGSGPVRLGQAINWHCDFKTGRQWPAHALADDLDYVELDGPSDVKVPWELNRCHHWVTLGRAYALQPDPRYAREFVAQLHAWLEDNPWPCGVNWGRAMEVAVRAVNWLWAAALFADAPEFSAADRRRLLKAMLQNGRHIIDNLEYADTNGNHYLSNGVGLFFLGTLFAEFAEAATWRKKGEEIVWGEIANQVHPDGVDFEQGIGYQGLVVEFWYACVALADRNGLPVPPLVRERLERMFDFMLAYTRPDGTFPQVGDNDDGRLAGLDDEPVGSHRRHLAVGGVLFDRPDLLGAADGVIETAAWLLGERVLSMPAQQHGQTSRAFERGGFYVMRADDIHMLIDAGEVGLRGIGGHGHADVLSFDLWAAGAPLLVDSGTGIYSANPALRQLLRSTQSHNTVRVDGQDSSRLGTGRWLWLIENDAHPNVALWQSTDDCDVLEASHDGYARLPQPVLHTRRIRFDKRKRALLIEDRLTGQGEHSVEVFLHPAVAFAHVGGAVNLKAPNADVWLFPPDGTMLREEPGWISRGYGLKERATVLVYEARAKVPICLRTDLVLVPSGTRLDAARSLVGRE